MTPPRLVRRTPPVAVGVVHLGLGAFFRAHGAIFLADAMAASGGAWGVLGASLRSAELRDRLAPQGCVYTAVELGPQGRRLRQVDVVQAVRVAPEDPAAVLAALADPAVRLVTLTVTEKGYCHVPATGRLDPAHPDVRHDLAAPLPRSAPGFLVRALARRRAAGLAPFTVLSCDNLPANGRLARRVVLDLAEAADPALADRIAAEARFPCTMVDRIVPATEPSDIDRLAAETGVLDAAPVLHEPFRQWVIEDAFVPGPRPDLAAAGAALVADVAPWERMKLRMLNGAHSALAYLGSLAGHGTVDEAVADPAFAAFLRRLWAAEIIPALAPPPPGADPAAYARTLLERFANPGIRHRLAQIAADGSQKLPQRILSTLADNLAAGRPSPGLLLVLAGWAVFVSGRDPSGRPHELRDPLAPALRAAAAGPDPVGALLSLEAIFPPRLAAALAPGLRLAHDRLRARGVRAALETLP